MHWAEEIFGENLEKLESSLRQRFEHPFSASLRDAPGEGVLFLQDLHTKKVFKIRKEELHFARDPYYRVCERVINRIQRGEYDNRPRNKAIVSDTERFDGDGPEGFIPMGLR